MKFPLPYLVFSAALLLLAGCSTVGSRISSQQSAFDAWPPAVQQRVRAGQVDIGFTRDQVRVSLGDPDRVMVRTAAKGRSEIWSYGDRHAHFHFGIGMGSWGRHSAYAGGVSVGSAGYSGERLRITFDDSGAVRLIERTDRY